MTKKIHRRRKNKSNTSMGFVLGIGLILIGLAAFLLLQGPTNPEEAQTVSRSVTPVEVNYPAPELSLQNVNGETESLIGYRDQVVLVNNWATWCPPCKAEMPAIEKVYNEYKEQGFIVLAVDQTYQDDPFDIMPFIEDYELTFPVLLDETGDIGRVYQVRSLPSSYFIDRYGFISDVVIGGPMSESLLRIRVEEALK